MKHMLSIVMVVVLSSASVGAADGISGTWMTGTGTNTQTYVFKVKQDTLIGLVCGPCDDPSTVFRIEDGKILDAQRATFFIRNDSGRMAVTATLSGNQLTLRSERGTPDVLTRVRENGVSVAQKVWTLKGPAGSGRQAPPAASPIEGKWVANGRVAQQNFVLKVQDNKVWGLVCGPCNADGVFMIDDGTIDGDRVTFYINHIDDAPPSAPQGLRRNIMRGTLLGNVMKFTWVREGAEDQPGGEMVLIGPIR